MRKQIENKFLNLNDGKNTVRGRKKNQYLVLILYGDNFVGTAM